MTSSVHRELVSIALPVGFGHDYIVSPDDQYEKYINGIHHI